MSDSLSNDIIVEKTPQKTIYEKFMENRETGLFKYMTIDLLVLLIELRGLRTAPQLKNPKLKCKITDRVIDIVSYIKTHLKLNKEDPLVCFFIFFQFLLVYLCSEDSITTSSRRIAR